jgi:hypothetical protein
MKKAELKKIIKECVKEVIFEEGMVSDLISEIAAGFVKANLLENRNAPKSQRKTEKKTESKPPVKRERESFKQNKKRLAESLNKRYGGVDLFEGTTPAVADKGAGQGALSSVDPKDKGVDISNIPGMNNWKHLVK